MKYLQLTSSRQKTGRFILRFGRKNKIRKERRKKGKKKEGVKGIQIAEKELKLSL